MRNVRIIYSKKDRMKYVSHLDMSRYVTRLVKNAAIPAWHTEGFNRHLYIAFVLPLSLGMTCDYDAFDIKVTDDAYSDNEIVESLNRICAEGMTVISAATVKMKPTELSFAKYTLSFKDEDTSLLCNLRDFFGKNEIIAQKTGKKGRINEVNLSEKIKTIETELSGRVMTVKIVLPAGCSENINPSLFLQVFCGAGNRRPEICTVNRDMIYNSDMLKFE